MNSWDWTELSVEMKLVRKPSGSIYYEKVKIVQPDDWSIGKLVDWIILSRLENGEEVLAITIGESK